MNKFLNVVVLWPGSTHDAYMLMNSHIADIFETGQIQTGCLLSNSAYPLKPWLLTPVSPPESRFNVAHKRTRCVIERMYRLWKMRFRCFHKSGGCLTFPKSIKLISSCQREYCNDCVRRNIFLLDDDDLDDDGDDDEDDDNDEDLECRMT